MKRKFVISTLILSVFWAIIFTIGNRNNTLNNRIRYIDGLTKTKVNSGEITKGEYIYQDFKARFNNLYQFSLYFYEYSRDNVGSVNVQLIELDSNNVVYNTVLDAENLNINGHHDFTFKSQKNSKGKKYRIKVTTDSEKGKAVGLLVTLLSEKSEIPLKTSLTHLNEENEAYLREGKKELKKNGVKPNEDVTLKYKVNYDLSYKVENKLNVFSTKVVIVLLSYVVLFAILIRKSGKSLVR